MTKRFKIKLSHIGELMDCETKTILAISDIAEELIPLCDLLNELYEENQYLKSLKWNQDCINEININMQQKQSLEKENRQLKQQIKDLHEADDISCRHCKHLQIDGMFGMWCDEDRDWKNTDAEYCPDYER